MEIDGQERRDSGLDLLFRPRSLAIIGVSPDTSKGGGFLWQRIQRHGYQGKKYPVSRRCSNINGIPCYKSVSEIPEEVDVVIAAVPAQGVDSVLEDCIRKGVRFVIIHGAGFAEAGKNGKILQERVVEAARSGGVRLVGPNCMGVFCPDIRLDTIVDVEEEALEPGGTAFCSQSGWVTEDFIAGGSARGLRFSTVVSSGNQADLDLYDYISYFAGDPGTKAIGAYIEGMRRGREFFDLASEVSRIKPLIIWKSGFSRSGNKAAISHSGSIAGNREIWMGGARSSGIITVTGPEEILDTAVAFSAPILAGGKKVGIIVEAGGGGISACDACEDLGLEVKPFSPGLRNKLDELLKEHLPPFSGTGNPLDLVWLPVDKAMDIILNCVQLIADEVDSIIYMSYLPFFMPEARPEYIKILSRLRDEMKLPIFIVPPYASRAVTGMKEFTLAGLPAFPSFERAAKAVSATSRYQSWISSV